ncbi:hypothetical protein MPSEU_000480400 [Mayamaea pseudoterrestris]|nr:hypothetical protein MPSEU_000480400 [Mayamaea pseudoterrestris]
MTKPGRRERLNSRDDGNKIHNRRLKRRRSSDSDLEDNVLVSMVTTWVNDDADEVEEETLHASPKRTRRPESYADNDYITSTSTSTPTPTPTPTTEIVFSVHVTQIAYSATDIEIRQHFASKAISIQSLRMVYDRGVDGRRQFRGVAFIDLADEQSHKMILTLHKSSFKGRKINVRPTKSKDELSGIVAATSQKVAEKIRKHKNEKDTEEGRDAKKPSPRNRDAANRRILRKQQKSRK